MKRELFGISMLIVILSVTAGVSYWVIGRLEQPKSQLQEKRESAELIRYYVVTENQGPVFVLRSKDQIIKIITHAELPRYDARARILYGFKVDIQQPDGELLWSENIYTRTRQSKDEERNGSYLHENTFGVNPSEQYGDDRLLEIRLPDAIPDGARLHFRLLGATGPQAQVKRALVRAYRQIRRSSVAQRLRYVSLGDSHKHAMAGRVDMPWDLFPETTKLSMLSRRWERMAALGEDGIDYHTHLVFYTGFRSPPERDDEKEGVHVHALHNAAINILVEEATELRLQAMRFDGQSRRCVPRLDRALATAPADEQPPITLQIESISADAGITTSVTVPGNGRAVTEILRVPAGLHSLHFRTESPVGAVFCLIADERDDPQFGDIATIRLGPDLEQLVVDARRLPAYVSGMAPDQPTIDTYIDGPPDLNARLFMFEVRMFMDGDEWDGPAPQLRYRFYDDDNRDLGEGTASWQPIFAPFEKIRMGFQHAPQPADSTASDGSATSPPIRHARDLSVAEEAALVHPVSEPMRFQVLAPDNARRVTVETDRPSVIRVLSRLDHRSRYDLPYRDYQPDYLLWRYGPRERRPWYPTRPENREELATSGRIARLRAQVRLEPRNSVTDLSSGDLATTRIEPIRPSQKQLILEEIRNERKAELGGAWSPGMYTLLDRPRRIAGAGSGKAPRIRYMVDGDGAEFLGMSVHITIQGMEPIVKRLSTPRGIWKLPFFPKGAPLVSCRLLPAEDEDIDEAELQARARALRCYIDQPPTSMANATIVRARTVFPLNHRPLRLRISKRTGQQVVVYAVVYSTWSKLIPGRVIRLTIDGGRPQRSVGTLVSGLTEAEQWWHLATPREQNPAIFVDLAGRSPGYARLISFRLGDDLQPGLHTITIKAPSLDGWVRFFTSDIVPAVEESAWQWKSKVP